MQSHGVSLCEIGDQEPGGPNGANLTEYEQAQEKLYILWRYYVRTPEHAVRWAASLARMSAEQGECAYLMYLLRSWPAAVRRG